MVDLDAALGEEFLKVAVGQAEAQVPADRQHDHSDGKRKPAKAERGAIERYDLKLWIGPLHVSATYPPA